MRGIRLTIAQGRLVAGDRLLPARELAEHLRVNFHTVRKAYGDLQAEGVLETHRGRGTFVCEGAKRMGAKGLNDLIKGHAQRIVEDLVGLDVDPKAITKSLQLEIEKALAKRRRSNS